MEYTKGEQELRDKIRDACYFNGAGIMAVTYADSIMGIPQVRAIPKLYEALLDTWECLCYWLANFEDEEHKALCDNTRDKINKAKKAIAEVNHES